MSKANRAGAIHRKTPALAQQKSASGSNGGSVIERLQALLGPAVFIRIPFGEKGPRQKDWQKLTLDDMTPEYLAKLNHRNNIGVLLGAPSNGLCSIDVDDDKEWDKFLASNLRLQDCLQSRGARGGNVWVRISGDYPKSGKLTLDGKPWGEWRADGNQTVIYGRHPKGCDYRHNGSQVLEITFTDIVWPPDVELPWKEPEGAAPDPPKEPEGPKPDVLDGWIILPSGTVGIYESAERMFNILAKAERHYVRGGRVFELIKEGAGARLELVSEQSFRSEIERHGPVAAWRADPSGTKCLLKLGVRCSLDTAYAWLASPAKNCLPPIVAVHGCAIAMECEGQLAILGTGYHPQFGGRLVTSIVTPGDLPDPMEAAELLLEMVSEFEFTTESDKARAIAAVLTPAFKFGGLLSTHTPLFVVEADDSQAGKGYLLEAIQAIYRENASIVTQRQGGVGGLDESLSQALLNGRPFIQLDNVRGHIGSAFFESVLTCPLGRTVPARVPYRGEVPVQPDQFIFQLTSNGFESTRDLANRSCIIRIRKRHNAIFRRYREGDILDHIRAKQSSYLGAVFSVAAQWLARDKPATDDLRGEGRFRPWTRVMDWIVQNFFGLSPLLEGHGEAQERTANPSLNWLRQVCIAVESEARLGNNLSASDIVDLCRTTLIPIRGISPEAEDEKSRMHVGAILGKLFANSARITCDGFDIVRTDEKRLFASSGQWKPAPRYTVLRSNQPTNSQPIQQTLISF